MDEISSFDVNAGVCGGVGGLEGEDDAVGADDGVGGLVPIAAVVPEDLLCPGALVEGAAGGMGATAGSDDGGFGLSELTVALTSGAEDWAGLTAGA